MFCRTCKKLSKAGSLYCQYCPGGKSFNCCICSGGHRCSVGTVTCPECGSGEFSEATPGIPTGWLAKIATVALLVALWKVSLAHYDRILPALGGGAAYTFGFLTNSDSHALGNVLQTLFTFLVMGWMGGLFLYFLPGNGGKVGTFLRGIPVRIALVALKVIPRLLVRLYGAVMALAGLVGNKASAHPAKPRGGKGE